MKPAGELLKALEKMEASEEGYNLAALQEVEEFNFLVLLWRIYHCWRQLVRACVRGGVVVCVNSTSGVRSDDMDAVLRPARGDEAESHWLVRSRVGAHPRACERRGSGGAEMRVRVCAIERSIRRSVCTSAFVKRT